MKHGLFLLLLLCGATFAQERPFAPDDVFRLAWASDPQVSPDGEFIVYTYNFMDIMEDRRRSNLWRVDSDGNNARPVTTGAVNDASPRIGPGGERLAYVSSDDTGAQIFLRWLEGGETLQLTRLAQSPSSLTWSPDGKWLAFSMLVPAEPEKFGKLPAKPEGAEWADPPVVEQRSRYRSDGRGDLPLGYRHVFVVPASGGAPRQLTSGDFNHGDSISWAGDSRSLYFSANRREDWQLEPRDTEIYRVPLAGGELQPVTDRYGPDNSVRVSPDGKRLAWLGHDDDHLSFQQNRLYVMEVSGGKPRDLLPDLDRSILQAEWGSDSRSLYIRYDDQGLTRLARVSLNGRYTVVSDQLSGLALSRPYTGATFGVGGRNAYAMTIGDSSRPADIAVGRDSGQPKRVTDLNGNWADHRDMARVETLWLESSHDGKPIQAWVAYPPGFDPEKRYPLILEIHGGPHTAYGPHFAAEIQLYAAAGYVVVYANPRGSTSYGSEFELEIDENYPSEDYDDLMDTVDAVIARGFVDSERLYVTGGSGGGTLTAWIIGSTDRFRAAVVAKPVINWTSFALTADLPAVFTRYWFPTTPWEDYEHYWRRSPLSRAGNVTTPTMLLTGAADLRTPMWETEQFYQALKLQGVDTVMVKIPGAYHSIARRPSQLIAKAAAVLAWFERYDGDSDEGGEKP